MKKITLFSAILTLSAALSGAQPRMPFADSLRTYFYVDRCCASALDACTRQKPQCTIAPRLVSYAKWMDSTGRITDEKMAENLHDRYYSLTHKQVSAIDNAGWPVSGDPKAPVTVTVYFSGTCPLCKTNYRELHSAVTHGPLKGKAKLVSKPLNSNPVNMILMAAHEMGKFTEFMFILAQRSGRIDENAMYAIIDNMKLDAQKIKSTLENAAFKTRMEAASNEAKKNGVEVVPTYFISGQKYKNTLDARWVVDAIEFEYENIKK